MRFDLLDEYSTLVPFGQGGSRNAAVQDRAVPAKAAQRGIIATSAGRLLRRFLGALRQGRGVPARDVKAGPQSASA